MMRRLPSPHFFMEFASLIIFWLLAMFCSAKTAIAVTLVFVAADTIRRLLSKASFPRLWVICSVLAVVFGGIDLLAPTPFMIRYEGCITNLVTCASFIWGAYGSPSLIQEMVEERQGFTFPPERQELQSFFRIFTLAWAAYFAAKAILYVWLGTHYPLPKTIALRSAFGTLSLAVMVLVSMQGRRVFFLCQRAGFFLPRPATDS
ncbi:hypothetical protein ACI01nite_13000 [Acetobacter cibinongensis]|uniref:Intracellular septation protein A n=1 Tax=Acetobacter cibinongensis TaxID=146475 RepID=A0A0D6N3S6_9PROT|nr:septation protein IspZ [Acetobacter cibinongensis]GAN60667.1 hypothetical protein Abci_016_013 [Acetobacter cibinongensis]GEL58698.1 hypothetical protein ACI01nite_13000 [Acetobacter cibinongensis]